MKKETSNLTTTKAMQYELLLCAVNPIKDNSTYEYWINRPEFADGKWHYVAIVVDKGIRTNYIGGVKL